MLASATPPLPPPLVVFMYKLQPFLFTSGFYRDCEDAYEHGIRISDVYTIQPDDDLPFQVYCDMDTDGGGWTVFQRRKDGSVDFYRGWLDYVRGFGNLNGEFWLGLRKIHRLTALSSAAAGNELRVDLDDFERNSAYAKYDSFAVGDSISKFSLSISEYNGTAGDSLAYHSGAQFSTKDHGLVNCAHDREGAWWYVDCAYSNLNGQYLRGVHSSGPYDGVQWHHWKGTYYSLKFSEMKVRHH